MNEFTFRNPPETLTRAQIEARIPAPPEGWTAQDDLALMEGLFKLVGLMRIAVSIRKPFDTVQERFLQLRRAAVEGAGPFSLSAQTDLLKIMRERAE